MITPTTMPMMRRAEGACRVLFMTSFSFSFCFSPFCCFCVENSGLEPGFNGRFVQSFANDDEHILPLRDGFQRSADSGGVQLQPAGGALRVRCKALHPQHMAAGGIRKQMVGSSLQLRYTPELVFELDDSLKYGAHMFDLLSKLEAEQKEKAGETGNDEA